MGPGIILEAEIVLSNINSIGHVHTSHQKTTGVWRNHFAVLHTHTPKNLHFSTGNVTAI